MWWTHTRTNKEKKKEDMTEAGKSKCLKRSLLFHTNASSLFLKNLSCSGSTNARTSKESPGTADDLSGRGERMQKPHVEQPSVNSEDVVKLGED